MPVDVSTLPPESREVYLDLGRRVTTPNTLAQANKTIRAFTKFGAEVTLHGYGPDDDAHLSDTRDTLIDRFTDGSDAKGASKLAAGAYVTARRDAKDERQSVRTLLTGCVPRLRDAGNVVDAKRLQSLLEQTSRAPNDTALLDHMKRLHALLGEPVLEPLIVNRGGPDMLLRIERSRNSLLSAIRERGGNPEVSALSDERDILDGIIVTLTRNAARAARVAARRLGQPAIAQEFKLVYFRATRNGSVEDGGEPTLPGVPATAEPVSR
jgi:hypothetical protein